MGTAVGTTVGAILAAVTTQYFTSKSSELYSEALSWLLLPILIKYGTRTDTRVLDSRPPSQGSVKSGTKAGCWTMALGQTVASFCAAENRMLGVTPTLTPILLLIEARLCQEPTMKLHRESITKNTTIRNLSLLRHEACPAAAIAVYAVYTLSDWSILGFAISAIELLGLIAVYTILLPKPPTSLGNVHSVDLVLQVQEIAARAVGALLVAIAIQVLFLGFIPFDGVSMLLAGAAKACTWFFTIEMARDSSWVTATVIKTFSAFATRSPYIQPSETQAIAHIIGAGLSLGQLMALMPKTMTDKRLLWALMLVPVLPYLANLLAIQSAHYRVTSFTNTQIHPIEAIIDTAKARFQQLQRQSTSVAEASTEYRRRYKMEPPPGFEAWFEYATKHHSRIMDDFDVMYESIVPFWRLTGQQVRQATRDTRKAPNSDVWKCTFRSESGKVRCVHQWRTFDRHISELFNRSLDGLKEVLPDVEFLVNHLDEPRVLLPFDHSARGITVTDLSHQPTWSRLVQHCNETQRSARTTSQDVATYGLPFVQNGSQAMDLCHHEEYEQMHGLFRSPKTMRLLEGMAPVLSTGAPSTMGDILFPSPAYSEDDFKYEPEHDMDWELKENNVYWTGSASGAFAADSDSQWRRFHRQRFVTLAQNLNGKHHAFYTITDGMVRQVTSSFLNSRLYDVGFSKIFQSDKWPRREQEFFYRIKPWTNKNKELHSRLVFDLDGNGISGRWYRLLASKSAPLKQTLLREWHDDRLVPWVHYIPVSQSMNELPELVAYFTSTKQGQRRVKEIAEQGTEWSRQALRREDIGVYLYRLLLELARLQDPERPAY